jgi:UDP-N-acetylglucosamine diphosphorylase/glucosamine-1-phosphate N-acetyltransferase
MEEGAGMAIPARLVMVEDDAVAGLDPLTLTRPAFELRLGMTTLRDKAARAAGLQQAPHAALIRSHLAAYWRERDPCLAINTLATEGRLHDQPALVVNARFIPGETFDLVHTIAQANRPVLGFCDDLPAFALVGPDQLRGLDEVHAVGAWFERLATQPGVETVATDGEWIRYPWDLVARNARHLERDFQNLTRKTNGQGPRFDLDEFLAGGQRALVGPADRLWIDPTARIDPFTVLDTTGGPIVIEAGALLQPFTRVEGPCYIGARTQLFRANLRGGVSLGPECRIGGEVEESLVLGYSNKYHEGFLGHAYIGEWVNLGAITSNSDLRNDYGPVVVPLGGDPVPSGMLKVGCFVGDHTRTGLGSMINTGTVVGVMCNLLPAGTLLPKHVPSFTAVLYGKVAPGFALDHLFATARTVKGRRGLSFTAAEEEFYLTLFERTRFERERAFARSAAKRWAHPASLPSVSASQQQHG